jgi:hypothetical protein
MRRIHIHLDEITYGNLRRLAFFCGRSLAATIRDLLHHELGDPVDKRRRKEWSFVGAGSSRDPYPVSEQHDRALAESEW